MNLENKKQISIVLLAVGLGLVAAILTGNHVQNSIQTETAKLSSEYEEKKIKPLMRDIEVLRDEVKKLASRQITAAQSAQEARTEAPSAPKSSLALKTPAGKRAFTVVIDSLSAVGGLINPNDYVDIIAHMDMPDPITNKKEKITSVVFQNIKVLAVGTNLQAPGGYEQQQASRSLNITMALTPEESSLMSFIGHNGQLQMILRAPQETETQMLQTASWSTLADYVFEKQGTELVIPRSRAMIEPVSSGRQEEVKPFIQIFQGGRQL